MSVQGDRLRALRDRFVKNSGEDDPYNDQDITVTGYTYWAVVQGLASIADEVDDLVDNPRDEYHTMRELYDYRMLYNALAARSFGDVGLAVKSWRHHDGELCFGGGWFIVAIHTLDGWVTNHYKAEHWDLFNVPEQETGPEWDGHTPAQAAERLRKELGG